jgi:hypothetical protein
MRCYVWLALLAAVLSGCIPYSEQPLTVPSSESLDSGILGTWVVYDDGETVFLHIGTSGTPKRLRLAMIEFDEDSGMKTTEWSGHTSRVGGRNYLNLQWAESTETQKGYLFVKYEIIDEKLGIALIRTPVVEKAIQAGDLKGEIKEGQWTTTVRLTDTPERLRAFVERNDKTLFEDMKFLDPILLPQSVSEKNR